MRILNQLIGCEMPKPKTLDEIIKESIRMRHPFQHFSTVIISKDKIIKSVGQSKRNNLILDNFGVFLAGLIRAPVSANTESGNFTAKDGTPNAWHMYRDVADQFEFNDGSGAGFHLQCGSGVTPATRSDYSIQTPLPTAPEDDVFPTGNGSYAGGAVSLAGAVSCGGAGTVNETVLYAYLNNKSNAIENVAFFHDLLVSGEAFVLGDTITVTYTVNL